MTDETLLTICLAAGQGTRMKSDLPKVLHPLVGRSMLGHVIDLTKTIRATSNAVVIAPGMGTVRQMVQETSPHSQIFVQDEQLGTAHAVLSARQAIETASGYVLILYGDTPLLTETTLSQVIVSLRDGADIAVLGFEAQDPKGYGRLITGDGHELLAIREEKDATEQERAITFCNSGVFGFRGEQMLQTLESIGNDNACGEYYLTDVVEIGRAKGLKIVALACAEEEVLGVNTREQLAGAERVLQNRLRAMAMADGATLIDPESVYFSHDTKIGRDVLIEPNVFFGPGVTVEDNVLIKGFSHIEQTHIGRGAVVGPYARLRPGANVGPEAKIGNFVEVKAAQIEEGAKVNHLTYIGDARVGAGANVGAGTITCNYDGVAKHHTDIGSGAFIGSNSALVAPVKIGDGAYVGSGSVITKNVSSDALAVTRSPQEEREGWAQKFRARRLREK